MLSDEISEPVVQLLLGCGEGLEGHGGEKLSLIHLCHSLGGLSSPYSVLLLMQRHQALLIGIASALVLGLRLIHSSMPLAPNSAASRACWACKRFSA